MPLQLDAAHPRAYTVESPGRGVDLGLPNDAFLLGAVWACVQFPTDLSYP